MLPFLEPMNKTNDMRIETQRLILRKLEEEDAERIFLMDSNPEVMKYIGTPVSTDLEESKYIIRMIQQQYKENGVGRLGVIEKESGLLIGWSGLKLLTKETNGHQNVLRTGISLLARILGKRLCYGSWDCFSGLWI